MFGRLHVSVYCYMCLLSAEAFVQVFSMRRCFKFILSCSCTNRYRTFVTYTLLYYNWPISNPILKFRSTKTPTEFYSVRIRCLCFILCSPPEMHYIMIYVLDGPMFNHILKFGIGIEYCISLHICVILDPI